MFTINKLEFPLECFFLFKILKEKMNKKKYCYIYTTKINYYAIYIKV